MSDAPAAKKRLVEKDGGTVSAVDGEAPADAAAAAAAAAAPAPAFTRPDGIVKPFKTKAEQDAFFEEAASLVGKVQEGLEVWDELLAVGGAGEFFEALTSVELCELNATSAELLLRLLISAFQSLEKEQVRAHFLCRASVPLFLSLSPQRRALETAMFPKLRKPLLKLDRAVAADAGHLRAERTYFPGLVRGYFVALSRADAALAADATRASEHAVLCARYVELFVDLLGQMPTRRFLHAYLEDAHLYTHSARSALAASKSDAGALFRGMLGMLKATLAFPVANQTGDEVSANEIEAQHCARATAFQRVAYKFFNEKLHDASMTGLHVVEDRRQLEKYLTKMTDADLLDLCHRLCLVDRATVSEKGLDKELGRGFFLDALALRHERRPDSSDLSGVPLYPDEAAMWHSGDVPAEAYTGAVPAALPKLNLQFLSLQDYLLRNFKLMQLESAHEIRSDIEAALPAMRASVSPQGAVSFAGRSRMLLPATSFEVVRVDAPPIGFTRPAAVRGELHFSTASVAYGSVRKEWEQLRQHDVLMLITLTQPRPDAAGFMERHGIEYVRGCEVVDMRDDDGNITTGHDLMGKSVELTGAARHVRVQLDTVAYQQDIVAGRGPLYDRIHLVMRRRPEENNFKAVLETIRSIMHSAGAVPKWLHQVFLGYGDPDSAHYTQLEEVDSSDEEGEEAAEDPVVVPSAKATRTLHLYAEDKPKPALITFSEKQAEAIRTANHEGLSLVVGPPGTGKTDVAVQIISNLYHKFPTQTILVITHSNAALNDIFMKVMEKDIDERHMLRLGSGERELATDRDFSRWGRVNFMLERRQALLERVAKLCRVLQVDEGFAQTCESSGHFYAHHVETRWACFLKDLPTPAGGADDAAAAHRWIMSNFPFADYFDDTLAPFWEQATDYARAKAVVDGAWTHLSELFEEVRDCRAFELLRTSTDRGNYLLTKQARIIAMTCTHAALKRKDFLKHNFKYDTLVMEESAQVLEVETFIPMTLQAPLESGDSRLKRVVLIGDHHQLPPVVKNQTFQKYCHMDQSMFTRFVRLGVPTVQLEAQGRMRQQLADLIRWRYTGLSDLAHIRSNPVFSTANAGLSYPFQCIDVPGREMQPQPNFFQNLAEAEYLVQLYKYMRLLGYDSRRITILTTYNGQKHLIKDVLNHRCPSGSLYGAHPTISTVDRFQGQQNDFILLSLVRTAKVGHFRDVRRLVVAMSRARLGLYMFGALGLFRNVWELQPAFERLCAHPTTLALNTDEVTSETTRAVGTTGPVTTVADANSLATLVGQVEKLAVQQKRVADTRLAKAAAPQQEDPRAAARARERQGFQACSTWDGPRAGCYFGTGSCGVGYYRDHWSTGFSERVREGGAVSIEAEKKMNPAEAARRRALEQVKRARIAATANSDSDED